MPRRLPGRAIQAGTITVTQLETAVANTVQTGGGPKITNVQVTSNSYVVLDDTAVDIAGGYIKITGTGFAAGCQVLINNTPATSTTFIGPTEVRAQLPASSAGTYMLYVINADGGVAIRVNGVTFSATPSWVTASDLTSYALGDAISIQLAATGASTFALAAGSTLPTGLTLSAGGLLSGSVTGLENDTSYSFTITATDAENQDSPRTFTISITVQLQVSGSLRFNYAARTTGLSRIFSQDGNRKTYTLSMWVKRSTLAVTQTLFSYSVSGDDNGWLTLWFTDDDKLRFQNWNGWYFISNMLFRDPASWYHLMLVVDTTQAVTTDRIKIYVNGSIITYTSSITFSLNQNTFINSANVHYIGRSLFDVKGHNGYMTEIHFIDGQALTPSAFAETNNLTGQYIPKKYTGTYGTNGFYLPFTDNSSVLNLGRNYQPLTADPFWNRTVLLLNGTGTNNAQNNTFTDSSTNAFAITRNGNTTQGRFSPFTQGGWSNYFDGTGDNLVLPSSSNLAFGTGDFCVEAWVYWTATGVLDAIYSNLTNSGGGDTQLAVQLTTGNKVQVAAWSTVFLTGATNVVSNTWNHIAVCRSGTTLSIFLNGTRDATTTSSNNWSSTNAFYIGDYPVGGAAFSGYISNLRVVKGSTPYDATLSSLTVPIAPLTAITNTQLLTCQSNRFLDASTNNFAITRNGDTSVTAFSPFTPTTAYSAATNGGSAYFDGTGDYLTAGNGASETNLSGDSSIELWFYPLATNKVITAKYSGGTNQFFINADSSNKIYAEYLGSTYYAKTSSGSYTLNAWNHLLITKSGTLAKMWLNGVYEGSWTVSSVNSSTNAIGIGGTTIGGTSFYGYLGGIKYSNLAVETGTNNITVPTTPLTTGAGTVLLLNFTNAGIVDATGDNNIETVGDAKISTAQSKWAGSSMLFDGTGDWLQLPASDVYAFGSGDYTVEAWVYFTSINNTNLQIIFGSGAAGGNSFFFSVDVDQISVGTSAAYISNQATSFTTGQWYHVVACRSNTTLRLFVNGTQAGSNVTDTTNWTSSGNARVGANSIGTQTVFGYIQDLRITRAARYTGNFTPPTAQFAYNQGDINYNQWVPTNFSVTAGAGNDSLLDVPTNWGVDTGLGGEVRGNYCVLNPLWTYNGPTLSNGSLDIATSSGSWRNAHGTFGITIGKWYWESTMSGTQFFVVGVGISAGVSTEYGSSEGNSWTYDGRAYKLGNAAGSNISYGATFGNGDIIGVALDMDVGTLTFYKNGVSQGVAFSTGLAGKILFPQFGVYASGTTSQSVNFGQRPFAYAAPTGFKSLNTHNLPALAVTKSNTAFDAKAYTGNGTSLTVSEFGFAPDLVWIKGRSTAYSHYLFDTIRGATKMLYSESASQEDTGATSLTAFTSNGFTVGTNIGVNNNATSHIAWAWDAGTTTVVNTAGTIQSNVRVNAAAGISIVSYTGTQATATVGHGLGTAPKLIIAKSRSVSTTNWVMYHNSLGSTSSLLILNSANAPMTITNYWGSTLPTSTVFGVHNGVSDNNNGNIIAYCFAEVPGFSSFGGWTGNGSADGPFIYTGFRPAMIIAKQTNTAGQNWYILDSNRSPSNVLNRRLYPNLSNSEDTDGNINCDLLSNGFKLRDAYTGWNASGGTYIYIAFAESPFKYARAR